MEPSTAKFINEAGYHHAPSNAMRALVRGDMLYVHEVIANNRDEYRDDLYTPMKMLVVSLADKRNIIVKNTRSYFLVDAYSLLQEAHSSLNGVLDQPFFLFIAGATYTSRGQVQYNILLAPVDTVMNSPSIVPKPSFLTEDAANNMTLLISDTPLPAPVREGDVVIDSEE